MHNMFTVNGAGGLDYAPHREYRLPSLVRAGTGTLRHKGSPDKPQEQPLYRLYWPGETQSDVQITSQPIRHWGSPYPDEQGDSSHYPLNLLVRSGVMPKNPPEAIAYHLAVNGNPRYAVAGLPPKYVASVLSGRFILTEKTYAAAVYLSWLAETHHQHPLLTYGFDTLVRETLMGVSHEAARLFFYTVGDGLYDPMTEWYSRSRESWAQVATYLHFVGRTGVGLYRRLSGLDDPFISGELGELRRSLDEWDRPSPVQPPA